MHNWTMIGNVMDLSKVVSESPEGAVIECWVQPRASKTKISGIHGDALKIQLMAPPVDGKANQALEKYLAKLLGTSKSAALVISGQSNRRKRVLIRTATRDKAISQIKQVLS